MSSESPKEASPPHPKRRYSLQALMLVALLSAGVAAGAVMRLQRPSSSKASAPDQGKPALYQCPMHPTIVSDRPSDCPICGMKLVKVAAAKPSVASPPAERKTLFYRSPMDAKQTSPTPKKDEMGMDYLPVYEGEASEATKVPGLATVEIDPDRQQLIGLTTSEVTLGPVGGAWRTVGRVAIDETRVRHINLKVSGFVERIYVDFVGKHVKRGDPLFSLFSPELLATQEEYLLALRSKAAMAKATGTPATDGDGLVAAARRKLALWDVPSAELERVAKTGEPTKSLTFYSPIAGVVTKKDVVQGMKLDAGAMPYEIVDLSSVWVLADVYETELRFVKEGMAASLELTAFPQREFKGKIVFIDPLLDPASRTVKVRLTFPNPAGDLRPEMFGEVILHGASREGVRVPMDAIIDSGTQKVVFVAIGAGKFQPRIVKVGQSDGAHAEIIEGVTADERVVTRANFLVDSESRLRASLADMAAGAGAPAPESARVLPGVSEPAPPAPPAAAPGTAGSARPPHAPEHRGHQP